AADPHGVDGPVAADDALGDLHDDVDVLGVGHVAADDQRGHAAGGPQRDQLDVGRGYGLAQQRPQELDVELDDDLEGFRSAVRVVTYQGHPRRAGGPPRDDDGAEVVGLRLHGGDVLAGVDHRADGQVGLHRNGARG